MFIQVCCETVEAMHVTGTTISWLLKRVQYIFWEDGVGMQDLRALKISMSYYNLIFEYQYKISRYFLWNFKCTLWNSTQNFLTTYWKMCCLFRDENRRALRFKSALEFYRFYPGACSLSHKPEHNPLTPYFTHYITHSLPHSPTTSLNTSPPHSLPPYSLHSSLTTSYLTTLLTTSLAYNLPHLLPHSLLPPSLHHSLTNSLATPLNNWVFF